MAISHKLNICSLSNTKHFFLLLFNVKLEMITCNSYTYWFEPWRYLANFFTIKAWVNFITTSIMLQNRVEIRSGSKQFLCPPEILGIFYDCLSHKWLEVTHGIANATIWESDELWHLIFCTCIMCGVLR